jgi:hypothetical protein
MTEFRVSLHANLLVIHVSGMLAKRNVFKIQSGWNEVDWAVEAVSTRIHGTADSQVVTSQISQSERCTKEPTVCSLYLRFNMPK